MEKLRDDYQLLLRRTNMTFFRYMHRRINWKNRMIGITGPRGVGKTTLVLQHIKKELPEESALYVTAEHLYFSTNHLIDLADRFDKMGGRYLFIDEIHKYPDWSRELKLIYDLHPDLNVVFTGSSVLDIAKGSADLSRRAVMYHMQGLSFREFLEMYHHIVLPQYTLEEILTHQVKISGNFKPLAFFSEYLRQGYYPFSLDEDYGIRLRQVINLAIETDIPQYAGINVATARKLKQLLSIIAQSVPFKPNISNIAQMLGASRNNIADYLLYIEEAGLMVQLRTDTGGIRGLGKVEKIYLDNPNLSYALAEKATDIGNVRETFFLNQMRVNHDPIASSVSDFQIDGKTFEIGGTNKTQKQIRNTPGGYVVKDGIETGYANIIPLWQFGLEY